MSLFDLKIDEKIADFGIGHATDNDALTGVSVVVCKEGAVCSCDVRGGGPATRETDLLSPEKMVERVHAIVLSGGSAFGLEAASGVARVLRDEKIGFRAGTEIVPIVPAACIFDLGVGKCVFPDVEMGKEGARNALDNVGKTQAPGVGVVGAGAGASVGLKGVPLVSPMKSGIGYSFASFGKLKVSALTVVNALGNVYESNGDFLAGIENEKTMIAAFKAMNVKSKFGGVKNTTLSVVMTNAKATKSMCKKVACCSHDGYARSINPVHTQNDGDAVFVMASDKVAADVDVISVMAAEVVEESIREAVRHAKSVAGLVGLSR